MKKKIIIVISIVALIIGFIVWNNRTASFITIDINPSIRINLNRKNEVKKVIALNKDAKKLVNNVKTKSLDDTLDNIVKIIGKSEYMGDDGVAHIILYSEGSISKNYVNKLVTKSFTDEDLFFDITYIKKISKEDEKIAKKYNITPAKASYINSIVKDKKGIDVKNLVDKSVSELKYTNESGYYCEEGYILENAFCLKEKERKRANNGDVCPNGYYNYEGTCYEIGESIETSTMTCNEGFIQEGDKCINKRIYDAVPKCSKGEYDGGLNKCVDKTYVGEAEEYCRLTPDEDLLYNGRCLARKPTINGGCLGSDVVINGWCYDTSPTSGYESDWICRTNGDIEFTGSEHKCYSRTEYDVSSYECEEGGTLSGRQCIIVDKIEGLRKKKVCSSGYNLVHNDICINPNKTINTEKGLVCDYPDSRLVGNTCILYDVKDAMKSN